MKIDKIVFSCSELFSPFWNIQSKKSIENYGQTGAGAVCSDFIYDCINKFEPSGESKQ